MSKNSQTSTEYLIILAVALIIATTVVGVLQISPSFQKQNKSRSTDLDLMTQPIGIKKYAVKSDVTKLILINNEGKLVKVNSLSFGGMNCTSIDFPFYLKVSQKKTITCSNINNSYLPESLTPTYSTNWVDMTNEAEFNSEITGFTVPTEQTLVLNNSINFDGINEKVTLAQDYSLDFGRTTDEFTISFWVKAGVQSTTAQEGIMGTKHALGRPYYIGYAGEIDNPIIFFKAYNNTNQVFTSISGNIIGEWNYVTAIKNATHFLLYRNANLESSSLYTIGNDINTSSTTSIGYYGADGYGNGTIDEVAIFNRVLSADEISTIYNNGNGLYADTSVAPFNSGLVAAYHFDEGTGSTTEDITGTSDGSLVNSPDWTIGKVGHYITTYLPQSTQ